MNFGRPTQKDEAFQMVDVSIDTGINLFDCADIYAQGESERILGEAFKRNGKRQDVLITSKVFNKMGPGPNDSGNSKHHILKACEDSLKRLQTDYIDIYFLHRSDFNVPQEESLEALDLLVKQGKIRYAGRSDMRVAPPIRPGGRSKLGGSPINTITPNLFANNRPIICSIAALKMRSFL
jgi:aryl-alcohol dehydrogenase-like predicted oxidoreductase